jgi:hypothetical protein
MTQLAELFTEIVALDKAAHSCGKSANAEAFIGMRDILIYKAVAAAKQLGYRAGIRIDTTILWPVFYIVLPDIGQVSWHVKNDDFKWDGHTYDMVYTRCQWYIDN